MSRRDRSESGSRSEPRSTMSTATRARILLTQTLRPSRTEIIDLGAVFVLGLLALWGLRSSWSGWWFLVVGGLGLVLGEFIAHVTNRLRQAAPVLALLVVVVFFLLGGPVALSVGGGSALPVPATIKDLADGLIHGWKDLLTTLPPVDNSGSLLVVPWVLGLVGGVLGVRIAASRLRIGWVAVPPLALLVAVILLGADHPVSWAQGVAFGLVLVVWLAIRAERDVASALGRGTWMRILLGGAMLGVGAVAAVAIAGPVAGGTTREVLRDHVVPPFDIGKYPSPLAGFRQFTKQKVPTAVNAHDKLLLTIGGVPDGTMVRFASLDRYDGTVWGASNGSSPGGVDSTFQHVGRSIDDPIGGSRVRATVRIGPGYAARTAFGVWLPVVGALRSLEFTGPDATDDARGFRYNLAAETGVIPQGLRPGDTYTFSAAVPAARLTARSQLYSGSVPVEADTTFAQQATAWAGAGSAYQRLGEIATHLRTEGYYSDGDGADALLYHPGHNVQRLDEFLNGSRIVGDDEQYAAAMALLANRIGVPARVVLGATVEHGKVYGRDVRAWVELLGSDGRTWYTFDRDRFTPTDPPPKTSPPQPQNNRKGVVVPPPAPAPPPSSLTDPTDTDLHAKPANGNPLGLPAWLWKVLVWGGIPILVVGAVCLLILAAKAWRRRRRRRHPRVLSRYLGGWREVLDRAADMGLPPVSQSTRREQARELAWAPAGPLAAVVDRQVFGPEDATPEAAEVYWRELERELGEWSAGRSRWKRIRVALSLRSFLRRTPIASLQLPDRARERARRITTRARAGIGRRDEEGAT